jgi:hypothetical protein
MISRTVASDGLVEHWSCKLNILAPPLSFTIEMNAVKHFEGKGIHIQVLERFRNRQLSTIVNR